jgi:predicted DCC family thiol-disulfide oxidoreductase YuxK
MQRIIFFDGDCNLCDSTVTSLFNIDKKHDFFFASLQSETAKNLLKSPDESPDSIVYYENGKSYFRSVAVIKILIQLGGSYRILGRFLSRVPRGMLDFFYKIIAKNRYRLFGKRPACRIPSADERAYFLD